MIAFQVPHLQRVIVDNPLSFFSEKMSEFCRKKNRELDELKKERDGEKKQKVQALKDFDNLIKQLEVNEQKLL